MWWFIHHCLVGEEAVAVDFDDEVVADASDFL